MRRKKKIDQKKKELDVLSNKFIELKSLVYEYKEKKEKEVEELTLHQKKFQKEIEQNKNDYEKILDQAADKIENFLKKANLENSIQ